MEDLDPQEIRDFPHDSQVDPEAAEAPTPESPSTPGQVQDGGDSPNSPKKPAVSLHRRRLSRSSIISPELPETDTSATEPLFTLSPTVYVRPTPPGADTSRSELPFTLSPTIYVPPTSPSEGTTYEDSNQTLLPTVYQGSGFTLSPNCYQAPPRSEFGPLPLTNQASPPPPPTRVKENRQNLYNPAGDRVPRAYPRPSPVTLDKDGKRTTAPWQSPNFPDLTCGYRSKVPESYYEQEESRIKGWQLAKPQQETENQPEKNSRKELLTVQEQTSEGQERTSTAAGELAEEQAESVGEQGETSIERLTATEADEGEPFSQEEEKEDTSIEDDESAEEYGEILIALDIVAEGEEAEKEDTSIADDESAEEYGEILIALDIVAEGEEAEKEDTSIADEEGAEEYGEILIALDIEAEEEGEPVDEGKERSPGEDEDKEASEEEEGNESPEGEAEEDSAGKEDDEESPEEEDSQKPPEKKDDQEPPEKEDDEEEHEGSPENEEEDEPQKKEDDDESPDRKEEEPPEEDADEDTPEEEGSQEPPQEEDDEKSPEEEGHEGSPEDEEHEEHEESPEDGDEVKLSDDEEDEDSPVKEDDEDPQEKEADDESSNRKEEESLEVDVEKGPREGEEGRQSPIEERSHENKDATSTAQKEDTEEQTEKLRAQEKVLEYQNIASEALKIMAGDSKVPQPGPAKLGKNSDLDQWLACAKKCQYLPEAIMKKLCEMVKELLMEESNVQPVSTPVTICGDIHGQFYDLLELFRVGGGMPDDTDIDAPTVATRIITSDDIEPPTEITDPKLKRKMKKSMSSSSSGDGSNVGSEVSDDDDDEEGRGRPRGIEAELGMKKGNQELLPGNQNYIFLGDFVDRGYFSLETFTLLMCLKAKFPDRITLVRGNHESRQITQVYGFYEECQQKYGNASVWKACCQVFDFLILAAVIDGKVLCVHGGLSPEIRTLDQIRVVARAQEIPHEGAFCDLVWSDPEDVETWAVSPRGAGWLFGDKVASEFNHVNGLQLIARAHQLVNEGFKWHFSDKSVVTVWSAPNYCYRCGNVASIMNLGEDLNPKFTIFSAVPDDQRAVPGATGRRADYFL